MTGPQSEIQIGDDEIFRRKLLMDGEGMGDDRRLNILMRSIQKYVDSKDESVEDIENGAQKILTELAHLEFLMAKSQMNQSAFKKEVEYYDKQRENIKTKISGEEKCIVGKKSELHKLRQVQKNKQEYDALAKVIAEQPDRQETLSKFEIVNGQIQELSTAEKVLKEKLSKKQAQFAVLVNAGQQLAKLQSSEDLEVDVDGVISKVLNKKT